MKRIGKPAQNEYAMYYDQYLDKVSKDIVLLEALNQNHKTLKSLFESLSEEKLQLPYAPGKWSLKELLMHLIDTERLFVFRAMWFARKDATPLPYFDEDAFVLAAEANKVNTKKLLKEYRTQRMATISFFDNLKIDQLKAKGVASQFNMSVRACAWIIYAHEEHHLKILRERYL